MKIIDLLLALCLLPWSSIDLFLKIVIFTDFQFIRAQNAKVNKMEHRATEELLSLW